MSVQDRLIGLFARNEGGADLLREGFSFIEAEARAPLDAEIQGLRVALERCIEAGDIAIDARDADARLATIPIGLFTAMEPLRHATREARLALDPKSPR